MAADPTASPMAKIKKIIQEKIESLQAQAMEDNDWCGKSLAMGKAKRENAAEELKDLNAEAQKAQALSDKLVEETASLDSEIVDLKAKAAKTTQQRAVEKTENIETIEEAKEGKQAVRMAITTLNNFLSAAQEDAAKAKEAKTEKVYAGEKTEGSMNMGITGMLEVVEADFDRTITTAEKEEKDAAKEQSEFMMETEKALVEKGIATKAKTKLKDSTDAEHDKLMDSMTGKSQELGAAIKELLQVKAACVDTATKSAEQIAAKREEVKALKKGLCILSATADSGADEC